MGVLMLNNYLQADEIPADQQPGRGKLAGQKPPLKPKEVWSIRALLQLNENAIWLRGRSCATCARNWLAPPV